MKTRVLLVDDHQVFTHGLQMVLSMQPDIEVVGSASNGEEAVTQAQQQQPDVVIMDILMPVMDGVTATRRLREQCPNCQVVLLTQYDTMERVWEGMRAGALSYVLKEDEPQDVLDAIRAVARGEPHLSPKPLRLWQQAMQRAPTWERDIAAEGGQLRLTDREYDVLRLLAANLSNRAIADRLVLSEDTVKWYVRQVCRKLGVKRQYVAEKARQQGLI